MSMHESVTRLLDCARRATAAKPASHRIEGLTDLGKAMGASSATITNWKARGVSADGALAAEGLFGCSAWWILHGKHPPSWKDAKASPLTDELLARLAADPAQSAIWENAIRGALGMEPIVPKEKRRAA